MLCSLYLFSFFVLSFYCHGLSILPSSSIIEHGSMYFFFLVCLLWFVFLFHYSIILIMSVSKFISRFKKVRTSIKVISGLVAGAATAVSVYWDSILVVINHF